MTRPPTHPPYIFKRFFSLLLLTSAGRAYRASYFIIRYGPQLKPKRRETLVRSLSGKEGERLMSWRFTISVEVSAMLWTT